MYQTDCEGDLSVSLKGGKMDVTACDTRIWTGI